MSTNERENQSFPLVFKGRKVFLANYSEVKQNLLDTLLRRWVIGGIIDEMNNGTLWLLRLCRELWILSFVRRKLLNLCREYVCAVVACPQTPRVFSETREVWESVDRQHDNCHESLDIGRLS